LFRFVTLAHAVRLALAAAAIAAFAQVAQAQQQAPLVGIEPLRATITEIDTTLRRGGLSLRALADLTERLGPARDDLRAKIADLEPRVGEIDARLKQLGPAPAKDAPPEDAAVAAERTRLTQARTEVDSAVKQPRCCKPAPSNSPERSRIGAAPPTPSNCSAARPTCSTRSSGARLRPRSRTKPPVCRLRKRNLARALEKGGATRMALAVLALFASRLRDSSRPLVAPHCPHQARGDALR